MTKYLYLQAGNSNIEMSSVELLEEAAEKVGALGDVGLASFRLVHKYSNEDNEYIDMEFYNLRKGDVRLRKDTIKLMYDERYTNPDVFSQKSVLHKDVKLLEVWNSMDKREVGKVSDVSLLLSKAASELKELGEVQVLDVTMYDCVDNDALYQPYIRIYYAK